MRMPISIIRVIRSFYFLSAVRKKSGHGNFHDLMIVFISKMVYCASAMSSISTSAALGRSFTAKAQRAGKGAVKNSA